MKKEKNVKIVIILFLCVAVVGFAVGFAAFSNTLTISSSATVSPDSSDFKITIYGRSATDEGDNYNSTTECFPETSNHVNRIPATIDNDNLIIKHEEINLYPSIGGIFNYYYLIVNEGEYDTYIRKEDFPSDAILKNTTVCTPIDENVNSSLLKEACENKMIDIFLYDAYDPDSYLDSYRYDDSNDYLKISPGGELLMEVGLGFVAYDNNGVQADGKYFVQFPDIELKFSTIKPQD